MSCRSELSQAYVPPRNPKGVLAPTHIMMFHPMFMVPEAPVTPSPVTPCPSPLMFHPMFMVHDVPPYVQAPLTPSPLTPCPSPQKVSLHPHIMMFHPMFNVPCPEAPPNPKSPNPMSQPARNPKGVLAPTHHDVPPYVHGPKAPLTPSPVTPCPNPLMFHPMFMVHDVPPYVHGPVPPGPPNHKSPNPLSQPQVP